MHGYDKNLEKLTLVVILGVCEALKSGVITIEESENIIFSPKLMSMMKNHEFNDDIISLIHIGTELENVESLMPEKLAEKLRAIQRSSINTLSGMPEMDFTKPKWYQHIFK